MPALAPSISLKFIGYGVSVLDDVRNKFVGTVVKRIRQTLAIVGVTIAAFVGACQTPTADDTDNPTPASQTVRVMTWNIQILGRKGTQQYDAAKAVLARIDADVAL